MTNPTQADIDAAAAFFRSKDCPVSVKMVLGYDPKAFIQVLAAHRLRSTDDLLSALEDARAALWAIEDSAVEAGFDRLGDIIASVLTKANSAIARHRGTV